MCYGILVNTYKKVWVSCDIHGYPNSYSERLDANCFLNKEQFDKWIGLNRLPYYKVFRFM